MAIDWGSKRMGVALSDETRTLARPLEVLEVRSSGEAAKKLAAVAVDQGVEEIVVGLPLNMDGSLGGSALEAQKLVENLRRRLPGVRFALVDERLSSVGAEAILRERGERTRGRKGRLDQVAASLLLQEYLDSGPR